MVELAIKPLSMPFWGITLRLRVAAVAASRVDHSILWSRPETAWERKYRLFFHVFWIVDWKLYIGITATTWKSSCPNQKAVSYQTIYQIWWFCRLRISKAFFWDWHLVYTHYTLWSNIPFNITVQPSTAYHIPEYWLFGLVDFWLKFSKFILSKVWFIRYHNLNFLIPVPFLSDSGLTECP